MSADKFNATLRNAVIERARKTMLQQLEASQLTAGKLSKTSSFRGQNIRSETNKASQGYESVVSRGGLNGLRQEFLRLANEADKTQDVRIKADKAAATLADQNLFDNFVTFIKNTEYKDSQFSDIQEPNTTGFTYQGTDFFDSDPNKGKKGGIRIGIAPEGERQRDIVTFTNLNHGDLKNLFVKFLKTQPIEASLVKFIDSNLNAGHLTGVFNARLRKIFNVTIDQSDDKDYRTLNVINTESAELDGALTQIFKLLSDADYLSSNITYDIGLFSRTTKNVHGSDTISVSAELQLGLYNQEAGRKLVGVALALDNLIIATDKSRSRIDDFQANQAYQALFSNLKGLSEFIGNLANNLSSSDIELPPDVTKRLQNILADKQTIDSLIETEGSDSVLTAIAKTIAYTIAGKKRPSKQTTVAKNTSVVKIKPKKSVSKKPSKTFKAPRVTQVSGVKSVAAIRQQRTSNLTNLQNLINQSLVERVKANMGRGNRRDVLNLRTGRFAESVKVERMSQSREGMITAFYSYMKNPYATFSQGGRQENPKSRDPKLLIAKSIREIATAQVANRLRSVSI
jgi:hypothetical protein